MSSDFPMPVGPRKMKLPMGRLGSLSPARARRTGLADGLDGFILADDAFVELVFHAEEAFAFFAAHAVDGYAGPHGDDFGDVVGGDDGLVGDLAPAFAQFVEFGLELDFLVAEVDGVVKALGFEGLFFFLLEAFEVDKGLAQADGVWCFVHADAAAGLVDEVDGLVGHEAVGHVACGEVGGGVEGLFGDDEFVVLLVAALDAFEDLDGLFDGGLFDEDGLEAAFEGGVALDVLAVFVEGGSADDLELAAAEGGLEDVGGVYAAAGCAGADEHVGLRR